MLPPGMFDPKGPPPELSGVKVYTHGNIVTCREHLYESFQPYNRVPKVHLGHLV